MAGKYTKPVSKNTQFARVDQGVDYSQSEPYVAIGSGTVYHIGSGFAGGTGKAVYIRLDHPVLVNGRVYREIYYAETTPLVKVGQHVKAGQPIQSGGGAEIGFAHGNGPAAPLVGGLGSGTQATKQGSDFFDFVNGKGSHAQGVAPIPTNVPQPPPGPPPNPTGPALPTPQPDQSGTMADTASTQPFEPPPGSGINSASPFVSELWNRIQATSPDTQLLAQNAQLTGG